jgi:NADPH-dependent curcumin reductase CurA
MVRTTAGSCTMAMTRRRSPGQLRIQEDILDGLDQAPRALIGVLHGDNTGKRLVRVAPEPS